MLMADNNATDVFFYFFYKSEPSLYSAHDNNFMQRQRNKKQNKTRKQINPLEI